MLTHDKQKLYNDEGNLKAPIVSHTHLDLTVDSFDVFSVERERGKSGYQSAPSDTIILVNTLFLDTY